MKAEIPREPLLSGDYPEHWYDAGSFCTRVLFEDEDYNEWVGVFGQSRDSTGLSKAIQFGQGSSAFILARGQGYIIDINSKALFHKTECDWLQDAIAIPNHNFIVACDWTDLYAYSNEGLLWQSNRIATDGIHFLEATQNYLTGQLWRPNLNDEDQWLRFRLYYDGWRIVVDKAG